MLTRLFEKAPGAAGKNFDKAFQVSVNEAMAPDNKDRVSIDIINYYGIHTGPEHIIQKGSGSSAHKRRRHRDRHPGEREQRRGGRLGHPPLPQILGHRRALLVDGGQLE